MENRVILGFIISVIGLILIFIPSFIVEKSTIIIWVYGIPTFIIGLIIILNKKEDKIEEINYKGGKRK
jgi:hypothetical protein